MKFIKLMFLVLICLVTIGIAFIGTAKSPGYHQPVTPPALEQVEDIEQKIM